MSDQIHIAPAESPAWLFEPRQVVRVMLERGMLMYRPDGGPYFLTDASRASNPIFATDSAVEFLLEHGWLTRVDDEEHGDPLYLLTAEGRRSGSGSLEQ